MDALRWMCGKRPRYEETQVEEGHSEEEGDSEETSSESASISSSPTSFRSSSAESINSNLQTEVENPPLDLKLKPIIMGIYVYFVHCVSSSCPFFTLPNCFFIGPIQPYRCMTPAERKERCATTWARWRASSLPDRGKAAQSVDSNPLLVLQYLVGRGQELGAEVDETSMQQLAKAYAKKAPCIIKSSKVQLLICCLRCLIRKKPYPNTPFYRRSSSRSPSPSIKSFCSFTAFLSGLRLFRFPRSPSSRDATTTMGRSSATRPPL